MDETYLGDLCAHLAEHAPETGRWTSSLRRPQTGDVTLRTFFSSDFMAIYGAAEKSGLPMPPSRTDDDMAQAMTEFNALAAVLVTHAYMTISHNQPHQPGGHDLGTVIGSVPKTQMSDPIVRVLLTAVGQRQHRMFTRILHHLKQAPLHTIDLRTVAALAYAVPGPSGPHILKTNPTGHYPDQPTAKGYWEPALEFTRSFTLRHAKQ